MFRHYLIECIGFTVINPEISTLCKLLLALKMYRYSTPMEKEKFLHCYQSMAMATL